MQVLAIIALCVASAFAAPNGYSHGAPALLRSENLGYGAGVALRSSAHHVPITKFVKNDDNYGTYNLDFQTGDGISQIEHGQLKNVGPEGPVNVKDGVVSYTSPEGQHISLSYIADEHGYRASGAHLPTPPPIPAEILKSLHAPRVHDSYGSGLLAAPAVHALPALRSSGYGHVSHGSSGLLLKSGGY